jgi:hypothetical protein
MEKRVFISLPMSGLDMITICENIASAREEYLNRNSSDTQNVIFVDNCACRRPPEYLPKEKYGVWYLGHAIVKLSWCDEVFFYGNWKEARGCLIEHEVCERYDIPFTEV